MAEGYICRRGGRGVPPSIDAKFAYTGRKRYEQRVMDGKLYHLFVFETSGDLTITGNFVGDVWMCGSGASKPYSGSPGAGGGGYTTNVFNVPIVSGAVTIGANTGAVGGATSYNGITAAGANGRDGGCGAGASYEGASGDVAWRAAGIGQHITTRPFQSLDMPPMCGGAGGRNYSPYSGGDGGSDGSDGLPRVSGSSKGCGGLYGGGDYVTAYAEADRTGLAYGGGVYGTGRAGDGCVMIRIPA